MQNELSMSILRIYTLSIREIKRFIKVYHQTIIAPVISALIFLSIFYLSMGKYTTKINNVDYIDFIGYGLIIISIIQNSFANSSSSIIMSKVLGYISDLIVTPFSGYEIVISYVIGSIFRGILIGILVALFLSPVVTYNLNHGFLLIFIIFNSTIFMGLVGVLAGLVTNNFDQNSAVTNYVIMPMSFLSGTFYSIKNLPIYFQYFNIINPFFYIIDSFRYCFINNSDGNITFGILYISFLNIILFLISAHLFNIGWKIKQ
jgi:ABC-2 type transport system permease protein